MTSVASVAATENVSGGHYAPARANPVQVGTIVWLSSELMFFAGLFAMYFTIRSVAPDLWSEADTLNIPFSTANTINLVLSSVWCQMGVFAAERYQVSTRGDRWYKVWTRQHGFQTWGMREWYALTYIAGAVFVAGQVYEYAHLVQEGLTIASSAYGSVFYLTTGFHGLHVTGGLIAFLLIIGRSFATRRYGSKDAAAAIVTSYYWHFVDVVWIGLFIVIYVIK